MMAKVYVLSSLLFAVMVMGCGCRLGCLQSHSQKQEAGTLLTEKTKSPGILVYVGDQWIADYKPRPSLVTEVHHIERPKFEVIDVHCHWALDRDPSVLIKAMDTLGIRMAVNLSGRYGDQLNQILDRFQKFAPDRLLVFCTPDLSRIDEPDFGRQVSTFITRACEKGAAGVKIYKDLGLSLKDQQGNLVTVDDPRLDPIWSTAGRLKVPVLIHTGDPAAFFEPVDVNNERWMQLKRHPNWSFYRPGIPNRDTVLSQRNRVLERHRDTNFVGAHMGSNAEDLKALATVLKQHPNFYVDISGRVAELGRQPYRARRFFIEFQDRILFGTDRYPGRPDQPRHRIYYRFLETEDEYFDYYNHPFPPTGEWKIYGIHLPDQVLKKIYQDNALRLLTRNTPNFESNP